MRRRWLIDQLFSDPNPSSASTDGWIGKLSLSWTPNDDQLWFVTLSEGQVAPQEIEHFFYLCQAQDKERLLAQILEYEDPESAIIFCNTKSDVRFVTAYLQRRGLDADQISGDLTQAAREIAIGKIKSGTLRFLVATDVAARGIDISDLSHVISYSSPDSPEVYVHRTGRTGRAGKAGIAISLVSGLDIGNFKYLQNVNKITVTERPVPTEADMGERLRERLAVKVEQDIRHLTPQDRALKVDRFLSAVEAMAGSAEGKRELAAICGTYLSEHRPETSVREDSAPAAAEAASDREPGDDANRASDEPPRPKRRRRSGGGGGGRGGGGGGRGGGRGRR